MAKQKGKLGLVKASNCLKGVFAMLEEESEREREFVKKTNVHKERVFELAMFFVDELMRQVSVHDKSKFSEPEKSKFAEVFDKTKNCEYGSHERNKITEDLGPVLQIHYSKNRHHPEFFGEAGVSGMNLVDIVEMICDWIAACERDGDKIGEKSFSINKKKYALSEQMVSVLKNTTELLTEWESKGG